MQLLRTWSVENAAICMANQPHILGKFSVEDLRGCLEEAIARGALETHPGGRVDPESVNLLYEQNDFPVYWRFEPHLKYRDTSEVSRYLQAGKEPAEIAAIMGWPVEDVQAVMKAQEG